MYWPHLLPSLSKKRERKNLCTRTHTENYSVKPFPRSWRDPATHIHTNLWTLDFSKISFPVHGRCPFWQGQLRGVPVPPDASIHHPVCPSPSNLPCPNLNNWVLHTVSKTWLRQPPWCATLAQPGLLCRGKGEVWGGSRPLPNILCVCSPAEPVPLVLLPLSPEGFKKMSSRLPQKPKLSERLEMGGTGRKNGDGEGKKLCLIFFHSLKIHSAFPRGLKFSLKTAVQ